MDKIKKAKEFFIKDRYAMITTGIDIVAVDKRYAKCSLKLDERHMNATGHVMGGAIFTLADFVFAVAANFEQPATVTTVSQISYMGSPKGNVLYGESRLLKDGKRTCYYEINITDEMGNPVAVVSASGMHIEGNGQSGRGLLCGSEAEV
ncbi:PaaI family thioesterase [Ruminococcus sp. Marseille-P6503]|uniref:PaaI family thioesterase n=1 Tax=Ruminococcus sp. Marseille-P6503 TaxID=2364796 RepID=UPI000F5420CB|nr:PaaI family thioesterase [Ruminococcus sp. Marseille-P6503]